MAVAIDFPTGAGQMCSDVRRGFILLSDVLGISMLVAPIDRRTGGTSTGSAVPGRFRSSAFPLSLRDEA